MPHTKFSWNIPHIHCVASNDLAWSNYSFDRSNSRSSGANNMGKDEKFAIKGIIFLLLLISILLVVDYIWVMPNLSV